MYISVVAHSGAIVDIMLTRVSIKIVPLFLRHGNCGRRAYPCRLREGLWVHKGTVNQYQLELRVYSSSWGIFWMFLDLADFGQIWSSHVHCVKLPGVLSWRNPTSHQHPLHRGILCWPRHFWVWCWRCHRPCPYVLCRDGAEEYAWPAGILFSAFFRFGSLRKLLVGLILEVLL